MGRSIHLINGLIPPLDLFDERLIDLPPGGELHVTVPIQDYKLLIFLKAEHRLKMPGFPDLTIHSGDALLQPYRGLQVYQALKPRAKSLLHVCRVIYDLPMLDPATPPPAPRRFALQKAETNFTAFVRCYLGDLYHLPGFLTPKRLDIIKEIREAIEAGSPGCRFRITGHLYHLTLEAAQEIHRFAPSDQLPEAQSKAMITVQKVKAYLLENYAHPLTLEDIAWNVRMSREHLSRIFKEVTGQTVFDYLTLLRIEAAKSHLFDLNVLIHEVATKCGFTSATLFGRTFKRLVGVTPLEYRRRQLGESRFHPSIRTS